MKKKKEKIKNWWKKIRGVEDKKNREVELEQNHNHNHRKRNRIVPVSRVSIGEERQSPLSNVSTTSFVEQLNKKEKKQEEVIEIV